MQGNPFDVPWVGDSDYYVRMTQGVFEVYSSKAAADRGEPRAFPIVDRDVYIRDMNKMFHMIIDGPLSVVLFSILFTTAILDSVLDWILDSVQFISYIYFL